MGKPIWTIWKGVERLANHCGGSLTKVLAWLKLQQLRPSALHADSYLTSQALVDVDSWCLTNRKVYHDLLWFTMIYRTCQDFGTFCDGMSVSRCDNDYNGSLKCISKIQIHWNSKIVRGNHDDQHWCNQVTSQTQVYCWGGRTGKNSMDFPLSMVKAPETWRQHQNLATLGFKNMANFGRLGMDSNGFPETPKTVYGRLSWVHLTLFLSEAPVLVASPQGLPTFQWCLNGSLGLLGGLHLGEPQSA